MKKVIAALMALIVVSGGICGFFGYTWQKISYA